MLRSCLIFFLKSVTVGIINNPVLNKHRFISQCLVNCVAWLTWFMLNCPGASMFKYHEFSRTPLHGSVMFLMVSVHIIPTAFLLVISNLPMVSVGRCVNEMQVVCVWLLHYDLCAIPHTPSHFHMVSSTGSNTSFQVILY